MPSVLDDFNTTPAKPPAMAAPVTPVVGGAGSVPPPTAAPPSLRAFGDSAATRDLIFSNVLKSAQAFEPLSNTQHTLSLHDVAYAGPETYSLADQKRAILGNQTLGRKLIGMWRLTDNATGQEIARRKTTLATIPYMTERGTFIHNGTEYTLGHQLRLRPGSYTRIKSNGELENHINVLPGKGLSHRVFMEPETGIFRLQMGQARIPLLPVLKAMGVRDQQLREAWGNDNLASNMAKDDPQAVTKVYSKLFKNDPPADPVSRGQAVAEALGKMELDPEVTQRTLGVPHKTLSPQAYLDITKKLLAVNKGEQEPDDRDHLAYQTLVGPEDLFAERLKQARANARLSLWKATNRGNLDHMTAGDWTPYIHAALLSSGLGSPLEEVNPLEIFDQQTRVTRMGEGGLPSTDAIPESSRMVHPSQFSFIDPLRTPESEKGGVELRLARGARKGPDGRIYAPVKDLRTGQSVYKTPQDLAEGSLVFPGERGKHVSAIVAGKLRRMRRNQARFAATQMEDTFSPLGNMVPIKSTVKGQRAVMASRMLTQALPLTGAEAPLVQSGIPGQQDRSFEEEYGTHLGAVRSKSGGIVTAVDPDQITIKGDDGQTQSYQLYNHMPLNRKTYLHHTPLVKPGEKVSPNQLVAHSNYTDPQGTAALGKNLRVGYLAFHGLDFEDAVVVSESAARDKLQSEHMYQHGYEWNDRLKRGKKAFASIFPGTYDRNTLEKFDETGIIRPGTTVQHGDPLVLVAQERERSRNALHRSRAPSYSDESITWDHHSPGVVTDVDVSDKGVNVIVKATAAAEIGDKLSGRMGDKGIISRIVPDHQMPHDADGNPLEIIVNPLGLPSRVNAAQIIEAGLGKISARTGKPYKLQDFGDTEDWTDFALKELQKHGISDTEDVTDPATGRKIPGVLVGNRWFMKLHHSAESKAQGRGLADYTAEGTPAKGGVEGAKRLGMLENHAILSSGATQVLRDASLVRGQAQPQYWSQFMSGYKPTVSKVPYVYEKFVNQLKASGINVLRDGPKTHIMALTDRDIDHLTGDRELQNTETVDWRAGLKEKKGGLFDPTLTGGHGGTQWAKITLHEPFPSPVMEDPIRRVLGLTENKFLDVIAGKVELGGHTGPAAIQQALSRINLPQAIEQARADIKSGKKTARDAAVRRLGYLKSAEQLGIHPRDWVWSKVPVLPPSFRPVSVMGDKKLPLVADPNFLYKELFDANKLLKQMQAHVDDVGDERLNVYRAMQGVTGLGDPIHPKNQERQVRGILQHVFSSSPKFSTVQRRLLGSSVDLVGRAVVTPDPDLDMDQVGLPEDKAWDIYRPFVVRHLVRRGMPRLQAARAAEARSQDARQALVQEMQNRPVIVNRAPTLHRFGIMAAWPRLTKNKTLSVSPLTVKGFGMDFDGDAANFHVPATDEAAQEAAEKMLPSRNLFSVATFKQPMHQPSQEYTAGLYAATARVDKHNRPIVFATAADAIRAYQRGEIGVDRQVEIRRP